jgi:amidophosphoribosyltransferase
VGASFVRDIEPGEIVKASASGLESRQGCAPGRRASCIFEYVYFARPDSVIDGEVVYHARRRMGRILAREAPVEADLVLGVPDSGVPPAIGFAEVSGIPYGDAIVKNRYVGRTFIQPTQEMRQMGIRIKLNPLPSIIRGKRLVVIDDSIVRGNTSKQLVEMLRSAGAAEVHLRIVSPEVLWPCYYGIDTATKDQLISANLSHGETCAYLGCDSLAFISLQGLRKAIRATHDGFCDACFSGDYPVGSFS